MTRMHTHNETLVRAPGDRCLRAAADVERWADILPHYRRVRFHRKDGFGRGRVEMAARRDFGPIPYPVWWVSEMVTDREAGTVRYRHVDGITRGMDVLWRLEPASRDPDVTRITVLHDWGGPGWPLIGAFAAERVIGPHFIRVVADRTLAGLREHLEGPAPGPAGGPEDAERQVTRAGGGHPGARAGGEGP